VNEESEMWKEWKKMKQDAHSQRRNNAPQQLTAAGIPFTEHNNGAHLILDTHMGFVDFWPGTTKWKIRNFPEQRGFGITKLLHLIQPEFAK
jgi:hypothetical protein